MRYWVVACSLFLAIPVVASTSYCPPNAFQGPTPNDCYTFGKNGRSFDESDTVCAMSGGHLASISNAFQNAVLSKIAALGSANYYRLGGKLGDDGKWMWNDGTKFTYTNWAKGRLLGKRCAANTNIPI